ncbi:hypothetical protein C8J56DRAFT_911706 [Mycena floridula]|nr:hypothetical protein C8J56DRAFT_911706 [Mycena floridula]
MSIAESISSRNHTSATTFPLQAMKSLAKRWGKSKADLDLEFGTSSDRRPLLPALVTISGPTSPGPGSSATIVPPRRQLSPTYGATNEGPSRSHVSPERLRRETSTLNRVPEDGAMDFEHDQESSDDEDEDLEDELLEERGLYKGSYKRLISAYSLTPLSSLLAILLLALLQVFLFTPQHKPTPEYPYAPYLPYPLPEILLSAAFWTLFYHLQSVSHIISSRFPPAISLLLSATMSALISTFLRLAAFAVLLIPQHMSHPVTTWHAAAFGRIWWLALGWATAESVVAVKQGYDAIALYRDVLVTVRKGPARLEDHNKSFFDSTAVGVSGESSVTNASSLSQLGDNPPDFFRVETEDQLDLSQPELPSLQTQIDRDLDQLTALKGREELEEIYGMPFIRIPVFISCLQRLNSVLLSIGLNLLLSAAYIRSAVSLPNPLFLPPQSNKPMTVVVPLVLLFSLFLNILHSPLLMPRIGTVTVVYVGLLCSLGSFFAGLIAWEVLE